MPQSLADPAAYDPSTAASAGRHPQDSHLDVSGAHHRGQPSAKSESNKSRNFNIMYSRIINA